MPTHAPAGCAPPTPSRSARLCIKQATIAERSGSYPQALSWLRRGIKLVADNEEAAAAKQRCTAARGVRGRPPVAGSPAGRRALAEPGRSSAARRADEREALAQAYFVLDWALVDLGRSDEAVHSQRASRVVRRAGQDSGRRPPIYNNLGIFAYYEGSLG